MSLRSRVRAALALTLTCSALVVAGPATTTLVRADAGMGAGGEYQSLPQPIRVYDSRAGTAINEPNPGAKPIGSPPQTFDIQLVGPGALDVPVGDVLGVVVSLIVTEPTIPGNLGAYPKDAPPVNPTSIVNFNAGSTVPNLAIVRPGTGGMLTLSLGSNRSGTAQVAVDVFGYFTTSSGTKAAGSGARLNVFPPVRMIDTRLTNTAPGPGGDLALPVRGTNGVPDSPAVTAVVVNITAVLPTALTFVSAVPEATNGVPPATSNVNVAPGAVKSNLSIVPIGADGAIHLYNAFGTTQLVVDVFGYLQTGASPDTRAGRVVPLASPFRTFDTRELGGALGPGQAEDWSFAAFANSVMINGAPIGNQSAVLGTLTEADLTRQYPTVPALSYLTVWPPSTSATPPTISNLNSYEGQSVPNMALLTYGTGATLRVYNYRGFVNYIFDAAAVVLAD